MTVEYTLQDIKQSISRQFYERGERYFRQGKVKEISFQNHASKISGEVEGSDIWPYQVNVEIVRYGKNGVEFLGDCSCPVGYNCKHVAALLLAGLARQQRGRDSRAKTEELDHFLRTWLQTLEKSLTPEKGSQHPPDVRQRILYELHLRHGLQGATLHLSVYSAYKKKDGTFSRRANYTIDSALKPVPPRFMLPADVKILRQLNTIRNRSAQIHDYQISGADGERLVREMVTTGRCFWEKTTASPLAAGKKRSGEINWRISEDGTQRVHCRVNGADIPVLPLTPPYYIDPLDNSCGPLDLGLPPEAAQALLTAPPIKPHEAQKIKQELARYQKTVPLPMPQSFAAKQDKKIKPTPRLHLSTTLLEKREFIGWQRNSRQDLQVPVARLSFDYQGALTGLGNPAAELTKVDEKQRLICIKRDKKNEERAVARLKRLNLLPVSEVARYYYIPPKSAHDFLMGDRRHELEDNDDIVNNWLNFVLHEVPKLRRRGWAVETAQDFPFNVVEPDEEWYAHIEEPEGTKWFEMELGVMVDNQRLNLLPILLETLRKYPSLLTDLQNLPREGKVFYTLPDGRQLALPTGRLKTILGFLKDLYNFEHLEDDGRLKLSRLEAAEVAELANDTAEQNLRWSGGTQTKELGRLLRDFTGISQTAPPRGLKTELRHYQQDGLNWLQFLREYKLAGILADDMGLGKTVQVLAHLALEKECGRLDKPCLAVVPTSVITNWRLEAERFTPKLKTLILHGSERRADFCRIQDHDLALTTYALLPRDEKKLKDREFHTIILDEAQYIKNPKTKAAQVAGRLRAEHRLCLTGTPLENHLGELWSLFNFLMPGLLGEERQFRRYYRNPIEKEQNEDRRRALLRRIKPFILRRSKDMVAKDLPPKSEIVQVCELAKGQRDLYETIRLSMHERVRREISQKGLARSHIVLLDALLKLRQVCCHPQLLKMEAAQKIGHSAKMDVLLEMLPELIEEGRRILLFSQFVSMLKIIEEKVSSRKIPYLKLTGQSKNRQRLIDAFQAGEAPLFLISLKAGGTGLNLTAADTVIHYDPWWNPAVENQATDRAHRIGQEKPVFVYKLISSGTVEEKILQLQERKRALAEGIFDRTAKSAAKLSAEDINGLFEPLGE